MSKQCLNVLLVEDDAEYAILVQHWLSAASDGSEFELNWTDTLAAAKARLDHGGIDMVLLDLGLPESDGIATFRQVHAAAANIPIVALTAGESEALALKIIESGAQDYLVKSSCSSESLVRAIRYAHLRHCTQTVPREEEKSRIICVAGAKGGVGTTTVASLLAVEVQSQANKKILLADMAGPNGLTSFYLGMPRPKYSVNDALHCIDRLDHQMWNMLVTTPQDQIDLLASPGFSEMSEQETALSSALVDPDILSRLLTFITTVYDWVVLDVGRFQAIPQSVAGARLDLVLVSSAAIPSLHAAKQILEYVEGRGCEDQHVHLVVNYCGDPEALGSRDLNELFGTRAVTSLPWDREEVHQALLEKRLPGTASHLRREVANMARRFVGMLERPEKSRMVQLLSFFKREKAPASVGTAG